MKLEEDSDIAEIEEDDGIEGKELFRQDPVGLRHLLTPFSHHEDGEEGFRRLGADNLNLHGYHRSV